MFDPWWLGSGEASLSSDESLTLSMMLSMRFDTADSSVIA